MPDCSALSSRDPDFPVITADNIAELIPSTYSLVPGAEVSVSCVSNLRLVGQNSFTCGADGEWSFTSKPYCTTEPVTTDDVNRDTKIMIGVVIGVAVLIIIILILMVLAVWYRDRKKRKARDVFISRLERDERRVYGRDYEYKFPNRQNSGPAIVGGFEMHGRPNRRDLPPPYEPPRRQRSHEDNLDRKFDDDAASDRTPRRNYSSEDIRKSGIYHDIGQYGRSRGSRRDPDLGNPMYLPGQRYHDDDYWENRRSTKGKKLKRSTLDKHDDRYQRMGSGPSVRDWVTGSRISNDDRALIHGRSARDSHVWRNMHDVDFDELERFIKRRKKRLKSGRTCIQDLGVT